MFCCDSASYFLKLIMLISLVGTLSQTRMGEVCITFSGIGPRRSQCALLMSKFRFLMHFQLFIIILDYSASNFLEMIMPIK